MKKFFLPYLAAAMSLLSLPVFSQAERGYNCLIRLARR